MRPLALPAALALLVASLLTAACGGDDSSPRDVASALPPAATLDRVDLAQSLQNLQELKSFRFDALIKLDLGSALGSTGDEFGDAFAALFLGLFSDLSINGSFVAPDQAALTLRFAGQEVQVVSIGDRTWVKEPGGAWTPTPSSALTGGLGSPTDLLGEVIPREVLQGAKTSKERVNGVEATRYSYDKATLEKLARDLGEDLGDIQSVDRANLDLWLLDERLPVKVALDVAGKDASGQAVSVRLEMNLRDLNDSSIKITPPTR